MNRESFHDLIKSIVVFIISILIGFIDFTKIISNESNSFFIVFLKNIFVLFAFIAIGNSISIIYIKRKESIKPMFTNSNLMFWNTIGFLILGTIAVGTLYSVLTITTFPILSIMVFSISGFVIGFESNVEMFLENKKSKNEKSKMLLEVFDHSIENNVPFVILAIVIIFPMDYFIEKSELQIAGKILMGISVLIIAFYIGIKATSKKWKYLEISENNNLGTELFLILLSVASIIGFQALSYSAIQGIRDSDNSINAKIAISIISGLIPIRLIPALFGNISLLVKTLNFICLGFYAFMISR